MIRRLLAVLMVAIAAVVLTACGSDSTDQSSTAAGAASSEGFDAAPFDKILEGTEGPSTFPALEPSPPIAKDKFVVHITCTLAGGGCALVDDAVKAASKKLGWRQLTIDTKGDPRLIVSAFQRAETLGADAIVVQALPEAQIKAPVARARKAGIPVFCVGCSILKSNENPPPDGLTYEVIWDTGRAGEVSAAHIVKETNGKANVLMLENREFPAVVDRGVQALEVFKQCDGCKIGETLTFPFTDVATSLSGKVKAILQKNPDINYVFAGADAFVTPANQAIVQLGRDDVHTTGVDAQPENVGIVGDGGAQSADAVSPLVAVAYAQMDNVNRFFNKAPLLEDNQIPTVLITKENAAAWTDGKTGNLNYPEEYAKFWGVE